MRGFARAPNCWRVTWRTADAAGAGTGLARNANDFEGMDTDRNATSRTDWPALCKGPVRPCAMNILQQIKEHNPKSSTSLAYSRSCRCMKPTPSLSAGGKKKSLVISSSRAVSKLCLGWNGFGHPAAQQHNTCCTGSSRCVRKLAGCSMPKLTRPPLACRRYARLQAPDARPDCCVHSRSPTDGHH